MKIYKTQLPLQGQTEEEFLRNTVTVLASHIANFVDNNQLSLETVRQMETMVPTATGKWDETDFQIFRELTYHSLNALGRITTTTTTTTTTNTTPPSFSAWLRRALQRSS